LKEEATESWYGERERMPPIVSIVGKSKSGKTWLLERLISKLKQRGYRIAAVKHEAHGFELDHPGKDSWRLAQAGSDMVILSSPEQLAMIRRVEHDSTLGELAPLIGEDIDLVLTEGYKRGKALKVEVHRKGMGELLCSPQELVAVATDEPLDLPVPQFSLEDTDGLADFLEEKFFSSRQQGEEVTLFINGSAVPLNPFVHNIFSKTLLGMVSALKGVEEVKSLHIWLRRS
jgi:molybdopterin-guanine dinucleotide biosynthesis protein B